MSTNERFAPAVVPGCPLDPAWNRLRPGGQGRAPLGCDQSVSFEVAARRVLGVPRHPSAPAREEFEGDPVEGLGRAEADVDGVSGIQCDDLGLRHRPPHEVGMIAPAIAE